MLTPVRIGQNKSSHPSCDAIMKVVAGLDDRWLSNQREESPGSIGQDSC